MASSCVLGRPSSCDVPTGERAVLAARGGRVRNNASVAGLLRPSVERRARRVWVRQRPFEHAAKEQGEAMEITKQEVEKVAKLARLEIDAG